MARKPITGQLPFHLKGLSVLHSENITMITDDIDTYQHDYATSLLAGAFKWVQVSREDWDALVILAVAVGAVGARV